MASTSIKIQYLHSCLCSQCHLFFCVILCAIQGVPVSKGDNLRSDPNYLLIFALYSNCLSQKGYNFVILAISHIHNGSGFDWFPLSQPWHWCMLLSLKCVKIPTQKVYHSSSIEASFVSFKGSNMLYDLWETKCQNVQVYNITVLVIPDISPLVWYQSPDPLEALWHYSGS